MGDGGRIRRGELKQSVATLEVTLSTVIIDGK